MTRMFPINVAAMSFASAPKPFTSKLADRIKSGDVKVAATLQDLPEYTLESGFIDLSHAVNAGLIGAEIALNVGYRVYLHEFNNFRDYGEQDEVVRVGVGIRFVFIVEVLNFNVDINGLAMLAAAAQLNFSRVTTHYRVIGIHGRTITECLPRTLDTLNTEGYARIVETIDKIRSHMHDTEGVSITPSILSVSGTDDQKSKSVTRELVARVAALQCIANGLSKTSARHELLDKRKMQPELASEIDSTYHELIGNADADVRPSKDSSEKAKQFLFGWTK